MSFNERYSLPELGYSAERWEEIPQNIEAIQKLYPDLPPQVIHQIRVSLQEGRPLYRPQIERLIEYARR